MQFPHYKLRSVCLYSNISRQALRKRINTFSNISVLKNRTVCLDVFIVEKDIHLESISTSMWKFNLDASYFIWPLLIQPHENKIRINLSWFLHHKQRSVCFFNVQVKFIVISKLFLSVISVKIIQCLWCIKYLKNIQVL